MRNKNSTDPLPFTRKAQLWYVIKEEPSLLFFINFTAAFFFIPLGFVASWLIVSYSSVATKEGITNIQCFLSILYPSLGFIPAVAIAGLGVCGVYNVIQELVLHTISHYSTFWKGIKTNWKQFLFAYFILGILVFLVPLNFASYYYLELEAVSKLVLLIISIVLLTCFMLIKHFLLFQMTLFNNSFIQILRNSIGFFNKRIGYNLLAFIASIAMYALAFFLPGEFRIVPLVILGTVWIMFTSLMNYLICIDTLERKLPMDQTKDFYHRGLEKD